MNFSSSAVLVQGPGLQYIRAAVAWLVGFRYLQKTPVACSRKEKWMGLVIQLFVGMQYAASVSS